MEKRGVYEKVKRGEELVRGGSTQHLRPHARMISRDAQKKEEGVNLRPPHL